MRVENMPPRALSRRNVRGGGWHKRGYRERGELYIQLKRSYANFSRTHSVNENATITSFIEGLYCEYHLGTFEALG